MHTRWPLPDRGVQDGSVLALEQSFAFLARDRHKFDTICNRVKSSSDEDRPLLVGGRHGLRSGDGKPYPPATATAIPSIRRRPVLTGFIVGSAGLADASTVRSCGWRKGALCPVFRRS